MLYSKHRILYFILISVCVCTLSSNHGLSSKKREIFPSQQENPMEAFMQISDSMFVFMFIFGLRVQLVYQRLNCHRTICSDYCQTSSFLHWLHVCCSLTNSPTLVLYGSPRLQYLAMLFMRDLIYISFITSI